MRRSDIERLATFNAERARGIVHTDEYRQRMAVLQAEFDQWAAPAFHQSKRRRSIVARILR